MPIFSLIGGISQAKAAKKAAKSQEKAAAADLAFQKEQAAKSEARLAPFVTAGTGALGTYQDSLGLNGAAGTARAVNAFQTAPGYQFQLQEGQKALERSAAARGNLFSGATGKGLIRYGQGVANQAYGTYQDRLSGLATLGENAGAQTGSIGLGYANNVSNALNNQGAAQASGYIGSANAWNNALNNIAQFAGNAISGEFGGGAGLGGNWFTNKKSWGWGG